jgi:hypothetical protein
MKRLLISLMLLVPVNSFASPITYSFIGENNLSGIFTLDDQTEWVTQSSSFGTYSSLSSPSHELSGSYGGCEFSGTPTLYTSHYRDLDSKSTFYDYWNVKTSVSSECGVVHIGLFIYSPTPDDPSLTPPLLNGVNEYNFQYSLSYNDNTFIGGRLQSLVQVHEPSILVLSLLGLFLIRRMRG